MDGKQLAIETVRLGLEVDGLKVTDEIIKEWKSHPATRLLLLQMKERQLEGMGEWASSSYQRESDLETMRANSEALGGMRLLETFIAAIDREQEA